MTSGDVVHLSVEPLISDGGVENVVQIDRQNLQETIGASGTDSVARVISVGPRISATSQAAIGKRVKDTLVWVFFRAKEDLRIMVSYLLV